VPTKVQQSNQNIKSAAVVAKLKIVPQLQKGWLPLGGINRATMGVRRIFSRGGPLGDFS